MKLEQGLQLLKIFKDHVSKTSILDDFSFYETRQKVMLEKRTKQQQFQRKACIISFIFKLQIAKKLVTISVAHAFQDNEFYSVADPEFLSHVLLARVHLFGDSARATTCSITYTLEIFIYFV